MKTTDHWLYLGNEVPAIGCGWRLCSVTIGRKWVYLRSSSCSHKVRLSIKKWCLIKDTMLRYWRRNRSEDKPSQFDTFKGVV